MSLRYFFFFTLFSYSLIVGRESVFAILLYTQPPTTNGMARLEIYRCVSVYFYILTPFPPPLAADTDIKKTSRRRRRVVCRTNQNRSKTVYVIIVLQTARV